MNVLTRAVIKGVVVTSQATTLSLVRPSLLPVLALPGHAVKRQTDAINKIPAINFLLFILYSNIF